VDAAVSASRVMLGVTMTCKPPAVIRQSVTVTVMAHRYYPRHNIVHQQPTLAGNEHVVGFYH